MSWNKKNTYTCVQLDQFTKNKWIIVVFSFTNNEYLCFSKEPYFAALCLHYSSPECGSDVILAWQHSRYNKDVKSSGTSDN